MAGKAHEVADEAKKQAQKPREKAGGERGGACRQEESSVIAGLIDKVSESSMSERVHPPLLA